MVSLSKVKDFSDETVKYAQQHLANERTYLAWLRTAISITGVGFLTTSLHFTIKISDNQFINTLAIFLGIYACVVGLISGVFATIQYSKKRKEIQNGKFIPAHHSIILVSILFSFLLFMIVLYLSLLLFN
ncbi:YidH family protein [Gottfriedia acidiceleris]|uniref:YidH family protein n=1 Tax=Gottfriedia acidiceleris TaxID=371036 RepID=UPI002FFECED5